MIFAIVFLTQSVCGRVPPLHPRLRLDLKLPVAWIANFQGNRREHRQHSNPLQMGCQSTKEASTHRSQAEEAEQKAEPDLLEQNASLKAEAEALRAEVGALKSETKASTHLCLRPPTAAVNPTIGELGQGAGWLQAKIGAAPTSQFVWSRMSPTIVSRADSSPTRESVGRT